jgi:hypothetical protein
MTKADLVDEIAQRTGLTKKDVADTVDEFLEAVSRALTAGKHIEIRGFGTFVKDRKPRTAGTRAQAPLCTSCPARCPSSSPRSRRIGWRWIRVRCRSLRASSRLFPPVVCSSPVVFLRWFVRA